MPKRPSSPEPENDMFAALELLSRQGYGSTSVEELADAAGMSRSTFFRRFGSKEDMVFADHERILARVDEHLAEGRGAPLATVAEAALLVFNHHIRNRDYAFLRHELLQQVELLRNRELITSHRYERSFRNYLAAALPSEMEHEYLSAAFAAAVVAVHNRALRRWFAEAPSGAGDTLDRAISLALERELRTLTEIFRPALLPQQTDAKSRPAVLVTILDPAAPREHIIESIRDALRE